MGGKLHFYSCFETLKIFWRSFIAKFSFIPQLQYSIRNLSPIYFFCPSFPFHMPPVSKSRSFIDINMLEWKKQYIYTNKMNSCSQKKCRRRKKNRELNLQYIAAFLDKDSLSILLLEAICWWLYSFIECLSCLRLDYTVEMYSHNEEIMTPCWMGSIKDLDWKTLKTSPRRGGCLSPVSRLCCGLTLVLNRPTPLWLKNNL